MGDRTKIIDMSRMKISDVVRFVLTVALLVGVYRETGVFTTIFGVLVAVVIEVLVGCLRQIKDHIITGEVDK